MGPGPETSSVRLFTSQKGLFECDLKAVGLDGIKAHPGEICVSAGSLVEQNSLEPIAAGTHAILKHSSLAPHIDVGVRVHPDALGGPIRGSRMIHQDEEI